MSDKTEGALRYLAFQMAMSLNGYKGQFNVLKHRCPYRKEDSKCSKCDAVVNDKICPHPPEFQNYFAGREIRTALQDGKPPDPEVMRPEIAEIILQYKNPFVT